MTSAQDSAGNEKWHKWWSHWARVLHNERYNAVLVEQIRAASRERIQKKVGRLQDYDQQQVTTKMKVFLGF
jgi:mRNA-degrading endonuclease toxin of MazEF toxin-antitoxin module